MLYNELSDFYRSRPGGQTQIQTFPRVQARVVSRSEYHAALGRCDIDSVSDRQELSTPNWENAPSLELVSRRVGPSAGKRPFLVFVVPSRNAASPLLGMLGGERNFDIAARFYEAPGLNDRLAEGAEFVMTGGLSKFHSAALFIASCNLQETYDGYFFLDGDLEFDASRLSHFLAFVHAAGLDLAQPSVTRDSHCYWKMAYHQPRFVFRETSFVEVMAPYMSGAALARLLPTFERSISSYGLDFAWPRLLGSGRIGIADFFQVRHAERVDFDSGPFYRYLASLGIDPLEEGRRLESEYSVKRVLPHSLRGYMKQKSSGPSRGPCLVSVRLPQAERFTRSQFVIDRATNLFSAGFARDEPGLSDALRTYLDSPEIGR